MDWHDRIVSDAETLFGKPRIKGTRISVELLLDRLADGWSVEDIIESYPHVTREDVRAALAFVAEIYREESFVATGKASA
jgi:uncharacterized protein (DUF433 family)